MSEHETLCQVLATAIEKAQATGNDPREFAVAAARAFKAGLATKPEVFVGGTVSPSSRSKRPSRSAASTGKPRPK